MDKSGRSSPTLGQADGAVHYRAVRLDTYRGVNRMKKHYGNSWRGFGNWSLRIGRAGEQMTRRVIQALVERNITPREVRSMEAQVNQLHIEIDEACIELIALRQPAAIDLRSSPRR